MVINLPRNVDVHTPHACNDIHGQNDRADNSQFAQNIGVLLRALVHADVDLSHVVAVGSAQETVCIVSKLIRQCM